MVERTDVVHVTPIVGKQWQVKSAGSDETLVFDTKAQAVQEGRRLAQGSPPSRLVIHHAAGHIESERP